MPYTLYVGPSSEGSFICYFGPSNSGPAQYSGKPSDGLPRPVQYKRAREHPWSPVRVHESIHLSDVSTASTWSSIMQCLQRIEPDGDGLSKSANTSSELDCSELLHEPPPCDDPTTSGLVNSPATFPYMKGSNVAVPSDNSSHSGPN